MAVSIRKLSASTVAPTRRILIYGDSGAGKTHLIGSAQDTKGMKDVLVADIDGGSGTLISRGDVSSAAARSAANVEEILWLLAQRKPEVANIGTLVLDGGSELQKRDLADIAAKAAASPSGARNRDQDLNELQDYKLNKSRLLRIFRMARDIEGINLIITAWAKKTMPKVPGTKQVDKDAAPTMITPDFTDGVMDALRGYVDDVWYLYYDTTSGVRRMVTSNYGPVVAKTRGSEFAARLGQNSKDGFVPIVDDPSFPKIWALYDEVLGVKR